MDQTIHTLHDAQTVATSGTIYGQPLNLSSMHGYFSVQAVITGSGTVTVDYEMSNSDVAPQVWSSPVGSAVIASGLTAGTYLYKFEPETVAKWLRLKVVETGASDPATVTTNLAAQ